MCTVSWIHDQDGYELLCNRDEKLARKSAREPRLSVRNGTRYLAPVDGDFGGTWIATNEFGISLCLLNGAQGQRAPGTRSRGLLVLDLIPLPSIAAIFTAVQAGDLSVYMPFTLAALEPGKPTAVIEWNGSRTKIHQHAEPHFMLTSSSFDTEAVCKGRAEPFAHLSKGVVDPGVLIRFHQSHEPARSAYSPCMHRPDAQTVSFSRICVSNGRADFCYKAGSPCARSDTAEYRTSLEMTKPVRLPAAPGGA